MTTTIFNVSSSLDANHFYAFYMLHSTEFTCSYTLQAAQCALVLFLKLVLADDWQISPLDLISSVLPVAHVHCSVHFLFSSDLEVKETRFDERQEVPQFALRIYP